MIYCGRHRYKCGLLHFMFTGNMASLSAEVSLLLFFPISCKYRTSLFLLWPHTVAGMHQQVWFQCVADTARNQPHSNQLSSNTVAIHALILTKTAVPPPRPSHRHSSLASQIQPTPARIASIAICGRVCWVRLARPSANHSHSVPLPFVPPWSYTVWR